jgi:hypothetical protein
MLSASVGSAARPREACGGATLARTGMTLGARIRAPT